MWPAEIVAGGPFFAPLAVWLLIQNGSHFWLTSSVTAKYSAKHFATVLCFRLLWFFLCLRTRVSAMFERRQECKDVCRSSCEYWSSILRYDLFVFRSDFFFFLSSWEFVLTLLLGISWRSKTSPKMSSYNKFCLLYFFWGGGLHLFFYVLSLLCAFIRNKKEKEKKGKRWHLCWRRYVNEGRQKRNTRIFQLT